MEKKKPYLFVLENHCILKYKHGIAVSINKFVYIFQREKRIIKAILSVH